MSLSFDLKKSFASGFSIDASFLSTRSCWCCSALLALVKAFYLNSSPA